MSSFTKAIYGPEESNFLTLNTRQAFTWLSKILMESSIFQYFNPERYIWVKTNNFDYTIDSIFGYINSEIRQ